MSRNRPSKPFISKRNQNRSINDDGGNKAADDGSTSPTEYIIHEITIIGNRPTATIAISSTVDTVNQRMLLMDKGNGLKSMIEKLQLSADEQIFPEVKSDDESINSENNTARSNESSARFPTQSPSCESDGIVMNENSWTMKLSKPIYIEKWLDSETDLKPSDDDEQAKGTDDGDAAAFATMQLSIVDTGEPEIEIEKIMDDTMQESIVNEIEKQSNEKSPTDEFDEQQFSIENGADGAKSKEENVLTIPVTATSHKNGFKNSTINYGEMPDALMDLILNSLLDDCTQIEKFENEVTSDDVKDSQIEHEALKLALQSILKEQEICIGDLENPASCSMHRRSITSDIGIEDEYEIKTFDYSISSTSSEIINDLMALSKHENTYDEIEQQSAAMDAATAVAESTVNEIIEDIQREQASVYLAMESMILDEEIYKDFVNAPLLPNIITKFETKKHEHARNIMDNEIDTSKSTAIEIAIKNQLLEQAITEEIGAAVKIVVELDEIKKNPSSTNVSINGLKDEPTDGNTDNAVNVESIATVLPFFDVDAIRSSSDTSSGHTTPIKPAEHEQGEEKIHVIVHEIMASLDKLFECVF